MSRRRKTHWLCTRKTAGVKCMTKNEPRKQLCVTCGKPKPTPSAPKHMAALNESYEHYIEINGGEFCGACGRAPTPGRRLDRDHAHTTTGLGEPRGLLCVDCNKHLGFWYTIGRLRQLLRYLERHEIRMGRMVIEDPEQRDEAADRESDDFVRRMSA